MNRTLATVAATFVFFQPFMAASSLARSEGRAERVQFEKGATSTVIKGEVKGYEYVDYLVGAGAGQTLDVRLATSNAASYFNINPPDGDVSMFIGSTSGGSFVGVLPTDGDYGIRVYLMRSAARRNESASYTLTIAVTGRPLAATPAGKDALIPGTRFHASAAIRCVPLAGAQEQECQAFVIRRGFDGTATVEVRSGESFRRRILFVKGKPVSSDSPDTLSAGRKGDSSMVTLGGGERYAIPDAFVTGG